ncbi:DUF397 domain-containing protein [Streptomyces avidinii]
MSSATRSPASACTDVAHVRDSKVTAGPEPAVAAASWGVFLAGVTARP